MRLPRGRDGYLRWKCGLGSTEKRYFVGIGGAWDWDPGQPDGATVDITLSETGKALGEGYGSDATSVLKSIAESIAWPFRAVFDPDREYCPRPARTIMFRRAESGKHFHVSCEM